MIDVAEHQRDRPAVADALRPGALQVVVEAAPVVDARESILQRRLGETLAFQPGGAPRVLQVQAPATQMTFAMQIVNR
jgi:hypothetical protein